MRCPFLKELPSPPDKTGWPWTEESTQLPDIMPDGFQWPKISIVTPSLNQGQFIEETIRSVLLQGYPNLEYIIIDGGSTDGTIEIIKKYEKWFTYWVSEPDKGQSYAINKGFDIATGDLFAWLNSDDRYLPNTLKTIALFEKKYPTYHAFAGGAQRVSGCGKILWARFPPGLSFDEIINWNSHFLPQASCFFRKEIWNKGIRIDENLHYALDYDLWLKIAKKFRFMKVDEILSQDVSHRDAKTVDFSKRADILAEIWFVLLRHGGEEITRKHIHTFASGYLRWQREMSRLYALPILGTLAKLLIRVGKKILR